MRRQFMFVLIAELSRLVSEVNVSPPFGQIGNRNFCVNFHRLHDMLLNLIHKQVLVPAHSQAACWPIAELAWPNQQ